MLKLCFTLSDYYYYFLICPSDNVQGNIHQNKKVDRVFIFILYHPSYILSGSTRRRFRFLLSAGFWTRSRGHRCLRPPRPRGICLHFNLAQGSALPLLVDFHRISLCSRCLSIIDCLKFMRRVDRRVANMITLMFIL